MKTMLVFVEVYEQTTLYSKTIGIDLYEKTQKDFLWNISNSIK